MSLTWNRVAALGIALAVALASGCHLLPSQKQVVPDVSLPRELDMVSLPDYQVAPPDILLIEAVRAVPKPPYKVEPLDVIYVQLSPSLPDEPLTGSYNVDPDGTITLGGSYGGVVRVSGLTIPEIKVDRKSVV